ncbi:MAG: hypothetical protein V4467_00230 [Patescibacteria group bacterium]
MNVTDIDVFIDLEGVGLGRTRGPKTPEEIERSVNSLLDQIPVGLTREGFQLRQLWGTASLWRGKTFLSSRIQHSLHRSFVSHRGTMYWTTEIADYALIGEVQNRLALGTLASAVLLVANDHDFRPLVVKLLKAQRYVVVSGIEVSQRLSRVASRTISLWELCGFDNTFVFKPSRVNLNPIDIELPSPQI